MTITRTFIPDPPASGHALEDFRAPPSLTGANLKVDDNVWAARRSYLDGCSTPVIAERHGLNERTVRRRAAQEGWAEMRRCERITPARREAEFLAGRRPTCAGEPASAESELVREPELEPFVAPHSYEVGELLLKPERERLSRFAFRRAAEAAASGVATEALAWMRLLHAVERAKAPLDKASRPFAASDYVRVAYAAQLRQTFEDSIFGEDELFAEDPDEEEEGAAA